MKKLFTYIKLYVIILLFILPSYAEDIQLLESKYTIDDARKLSIETAYAEKKHFKKLMYNDTSLGFNDARVWIYIKIKNPTAQELSNVVKFHYPLHDYITVYEYKDSKLLNKYLTGDLTNFDTRKIKTNTFVIPYTIQANETKEIMFRIDSDSSLNIGMEFLPLDEYYSSSSQKDLFLGSYFGAAFIMLIYNFILFLIIKEHIYLDYVTFHFSYLFLQLGLNGFAFQYFYPTFPELNSYFIPVMFTLANYFSMQFISSFLNLKKYAPTIDAFFKIFKNIFLFTLLLSFYMPYSFIITVMVVLSILNIVSLFITGIYIWYTHRSVGSKFFIAAWSFLLIGALLEEMQDLGVIPMSSITIHGAQIGAFFELALFSFALAYRYNIIFIRLSKVESDLRGLNKSLEVKVEERTYDLDEKNSQLSMEIHKKNVLFRELYHRVKNNLQIISGLLSLQSRRIKEKSSKVIFEETNQRIKAMALIHEKLYQSDDFESVNMQEYTKNLVSDMRQSFHTKHLAFNIHCDDINLNLEVAVPMGLIINELVTNAIKYAFPKTQKHHNISIKMYTTNDTFILEVYDNGIGIDLEKLEEGFGFKLLESLAKYQLKGVVNRYNDKGLHHEIIFSKGLLL